MKTETFAQIGVLGAGVMGGGIAQMFAAAGKDVLLWDLEEEVLQKGVAAIEKRLHRSVAKGSLQAIEAAAIMARIKPVQQPADLQQAGLIIEAVVEDMTIKMELLERVSRQAGADAILATNTSSLSVNELATASGAPHGFLGLHFFNPPTKLELVEVVPTASTDAAVVTAVIKLLRECGKTPVIVKDAPGFIVNRLLLLLINEAAKMVAEGVASPEDIDTAMRLGALHPAGPLAVADLIGLDTCGKILQRLQQALARPEFEPAAAITEAVEQGRFGRKSGSGFFEY